MSGFSVTVLHNAPLALQRLLSLSILLIIMSAALFVSYAGYSLLTERAESVRVLRQSAGTLMSVVKLRKALENPSAEQPDEALTGQVLEGATASLARAELQSRLNAIGKSEGIAIASVGNAPDRQLDEIQQIGLTTNISGDLISVHNTIFSLETVTPPIFIDDIVVRLTGSNGRSNASGEPIISAQFKIYGFFIDAAETVDEAQ